MAPLLRRVVWSSPFFVSKSLAVCLFRSMYFHCRVAISLLRSKKELILIFIEGQFTDLPHDADVAKRFESFWNDAMVKALEELSEQEGLNADGLQKVIDEYLFTEKKPQRDEVINILLERPRLKERKNKAERVIGRIQEFFERFIEGVDFFG